MMPTYMMSSNSLMPLDLNEEDQSHQASSSSSSSLPYPLRFNPHHHSLTADHVEAEKVEILCGGSCMNWKKKDMNEFNSEVDHQDDGSTKWMCSETRMMSPELEQTKRTDTPAVYVAPNSTPKFEEEEEEEDGLNHDEKQPAASDNNTSATTSCSNHNHHIINVRVCADCHTTKTPLWRSGPTGPKSLCNACGIRQRKARRAMAAAESGATSVAAEGGVVVKGDKLQKKQKKVELKKKGKVVGRKVRGGKKKFGFEDLALRLSNNLGGVQQVFPQDEKEAAILLMALSYGLVHG